MTSSERTLLLWLARGRKVIECGSLIGNSTVPVAQVASKVVSIDKHEGYGPPTLKRFLTNIDAVAHKVDVKVGDVAYFLPGIDADVCLIDLLGTYELTKWCLEHLHPSLTFVAVHDCHRPHCGGVDAAIEASRAVWEPFGQADTLTMLRRI